MEFTDTLLVSVEFTDTLLVSVDFTNGRDHSVLIVGRKHPNQAVDIVNAFQGEDAEKIYKMLIEKKVSNADVSESLGS